MSDFRREASLLAWAVRQWGTMVIIQAALGMECVVMLKHELVGGERSEREERRQEEQRRAEERKKR